VNTISTLTLWLTLLGILIVAWLVWKNLRVRWVSQKEADQRRQVEDALKLIFNLKQKSQTTDQYRLAIELKINLQAVQALISRLEAQQLVLVDQSRHLNLTADGQRWALQVIRAHRLWERYLADEARMPLEQVHTAAHRREHQMSLDEVNALDAAMGYPARDPHGDPIPNAAGALRDAKTSTALIRLEPGQRGQINQLEDEPPLAYAQLLAEGLYVGQSIIVLENSPARVVLNSGESEYTLAPSIAENVSVYLEILKEQPDPAVIPLGELLSKAQAEIVCIDDRCQGFTRRRFLDLGLTPGTTIFPELENAFRDPRAYRVRGTLIALRSDQARLIWVRPVTNGAVLQ
jgi:DtxR family Mn-dependent transcriptional regulator